MWWGCVIQKSIYLLDGMFILCTLWLIGIFFFGILVYWIYCVDSAMQKNKSYFTHSHQSVLIMWRISFLWHAFQMEFYRFDCRFIGTVIVSTSTNTSQFVIRVNVFGFFLPRIWIFLPRGPIFMNVCRLVFSISKLLH